MRLLRRADSLNRHARRSLTDTDGQNWDRSSLTELLIAVPASHRTWFVVSGVGRAALGRVLSAEEWCGARSSLHVGYLPPPPPDGKRGVRGMKVAGAHYRYT